MHEDRMLMEARITREARTRVLPLVHPHRMPLSVMAGAGAEKPDALEPFSVGDRWGAPWGTTWFELTGDVPDAWAGRRVEAVIDLGFRLDAPGFQCEGLVVDGDGRPIQGIHPRRTRVPVPSAPGPVRLIVEAASNPVFPQFQPSPMGSPDTAGDRPLYRFERADLVTVDGDAEALLLDIDVLDGMMRTLAHDDPRRAQVRAALVRALDALPDARSARRRLAGPLDLPARASAHHIVATGHAHIDTAWLWPMRETRRKCTRTFASAVALMDDDPEYRFSCSQAQQYAWIEEEQPELFERIREKVAGGQWVPVGGMWVEADMNLPSGESLARQIVFGQRYFEERFGRRCTEVWIPDVFGYPAGLPQVFAQGGMRRFVTQKLSWNTTNRFPHHTFWWEGLDGTRVLTHFPPVDTYNSDVSPAEVAYASANFRDHGWSRWSLLPFGYGDGGGGPTREMLGRAHRMADLDGMPTVRLGTPDEFFHEVEAELASGDAPVWRGELYFETHRGTLTSQLRTKLGNRRCERLLYEAELYAAMLGRRADVDDHWRDVLTQQFHDILPGSSIAWVHADAEAVFERVATELESKIAGMLGELAVAAAGVRDADGDHAAARITVANPAGSRRREVVEVGEPVLVDVAPCSVAQVTPATPTRPVVVTDRSMSNGYLAMRWDPDGAIISLIDVTNARELIPDGERAAQLELAPDHPVNYDAWDLEAWTRSNARPVQRSPDDGKPRVADAGPLVGRVVIGRTFGASSATVTYTMRAESRRVDIHVELDWQHDEHLLSMAFPLDVHTDNAWCDVQFGVVSRPTHRSTSWDAAKFEVCAHRFVALSEPGFGAAVLNDGRYGHSVFDGAIRVSLARAAKYPDPGADHGRHEVTLSLMPFDGDLARVRDEAEALNRPLRVVRSGVPGDDPGAGGTADPDGRAATEGHTAVEGAMGGSFVSTLCDGVELDAVKLADDGSGDLVVRLHEHRGARTRATLHAPWPIGAASRCNLMEEPIDAYEVSDGVLAFTLRPFEIQTLRLTPR